MWRHPLDDFIPWLLGSIVDETAVALGLKPPEDLPQTKLPPAIAALGYAAIGVFLGVVSLIVRRQAFVPERLALPALVAAPLLGGIALLGAGLWLRMKGHHRRTTSFTTFWGGAGLACGFAFIRFVLAY